MPFLPSRLQLVAVAVLCLPISLSPSFGNEADVETTPIRALLITGGCCHDYDTQRQIIQDGLRERLNITFEVVQGDSTKTDELAVYRDPDWAAGYDVVIHNECYGDVVDEDFVAGIVKAHLDGTPAVFIHCAMHSYRSSPAADQWRSLIGLTSRRHESKHPVTVRPEQPDHPILRDFPTEWTTQQGELYIVERTWPGCDVLATAIGNESVTPQPVLWTNTRGRTRVFGTTLGHYNGTMQHPNFLTTLAHGIEWVLDDAAGGDATERDATEGVGSDQPASAD